MPDFKYALPRGYIIEGYRIEKVIGGGGFSFVYLAYHIRTKVKVVIKEYFPHDLVTRMPGGRIFPRDDTSRTPFQMGMKRFFSEGMALAKLKHENIIAVSNFFRSSGTVFMVMEFEQGRDLRFFIKRAKGRLSQEFILSVFPKILSGLSTLHAHEFLHLDIKPANILLRASGVPVLLDFGAVQQVKPGNRLRGVQTLTHGYAPPEQYEEGEMGPWSDLYSIGMTMRTCMTGKHPPPSLERRKKDTVIPVSKSHARKFAKSVLQAIDWATELDHRKRPKEVSEFLRLLLGDTPVTGPRTAVESQD